MDYKEAIEKAASIFKERNEAYGNSFAKLYSRFGIISALTQMNHKMSRLENLVGTKFREGDIERGKELSLSVMDTLIDLANYALMTYVEVGNRLEFHDRQRINNNPNRGSELKFKFDVTEEELELIAKLREIKKMLEK